MRVRAALLTFAALALGGASAPAPAPASDVISATTIEFTAQEGTTSPPRRVTFTRGGGSKKALPVVVSMDGAGAGSFATSSTCTVPLLQGQSCAVDVTFSPAAAGTYTAQLTFAVGSNTLVATLRGTATAAPPPPAPPAPAPPPPAPVTPPATAPTPAPEAQVSPGSLSFAAQVGTTSGRVPVQLRNTGDAPLQTSSIQLVGAGSSSFVLSAGTCGTTLAASAACTVDVAFLPRAVGGFSALLRFVGNAPDGIADVSLSGVATAAPPPTVTPAGSAAVLPLPPAPPPPAAPSTPVGASAVRNPTPTTPSAPRPVRPSADRDRDGIPDRIDACPTVPGDLKNGCPRELNADIRGTWRVNRLFTKIVSLSVRAPVGSRIDVRCSGARKVCPFQRRTIARTTRRVTVLTRFFSRAQLLPAGTAITVRVTNRGRIGTYERLLTRAGRMLPKVTQRCIDRRTRIVLCA